MEAIYLIVFSLGIIGVSFYYFPFFICIFLSIVTIGVSFFYNRKISVFIALILTIFLYRLDTKIYKDIVSVGDVVDIEGSVISGRGKINKIDGKFPLERIYFIVDRVEDSDIFLNGTVEKITRKSWGNYYKIIPDVVEEDSNFFKKYFKRNIESITENFGSDFENFYKGVILGEGELLDYELVKKFRKIGISHLLVISGLHISIIIYGILNFLKIFKMKKEIRYSLAMIFLSIYVFSIGLSPSIFRAYIMGCIYLLGNILYEKVNSKKSLCIAFIISLIINPQWLYSISFIMSYGAVFSIIYVYPIIPKFKFKKVVNSLILILTIQICMMPITFIFFKNIQIFSFISNFILIPIGSLFVLFAFFTLFLSFFSLGWIGSYITYFMYLFFMKSVDVLENIPYLTLEL